MNKKEEKPLYLGHRARLKERFLRDEGVSMADYEFLELVLTYAIPKRDVKEDAKKLVEHFGSYVGVINASQEKLLEYGLSENTVVLLKLIKSSLMRMTFEKLHSNDRPVYSNYDDLLDYCKTHIINPEIEEFHVMFLDTANHFISEKIMSRGTIDQVMAYPREVLAEAVRQNAKKCVLFHNHPSGTLSASQADVEQTRRIAEALAPCGISVYNHFIITRDGAYDLRSSKKLEHLFS